MTKSIYDYQVRNKNKEDWNKLRIAAYTRVSTNDQFINGASMDTQLNEIIKRYKFNKDIYSFSKARNHYTDWGESWASEHRPELDRMIKDIENWDIDVVIVYKIDRLFRKLLFLLQFIEKISKLWVYIISIKDNIDTSDAKWMIMLQFMWIIWDIERDNIRIRTIDWKVTKAKQWYYVWWWKVPYWFRLEGTPLWKKAYVNKDEAIVINRIFDLYVKKTKSLWEIARILTNEKILTRDDKVKIKLEKENNKLDRYKEKEGLNDNEINHQKWTKKENDWKWYASSIRKILMNKMHMWIYEYWKTTKVWDKKKEKNILVKNPADKIVPFNLEEYTLKDISIFEDAQKLLEKNIVSKSSTSPYLFTWLIKCWLCWFHYNWYKSSKWTFNYRCKWGMSWSNVSPRCRNSDISEELLFKYCWSELDRNLSNPDNFKAVIFDEEKNKEIISDLNRRINVIFTLIKTKKNNLESAIVNEIETDNETKKIIYKKKIWEYEKEILDLEIEDNEARREISIIKSNEKKRDDIKNFNEQHEKAINNITEFRKSELIKRYVKLIDRNPWKLKIRFNILDELEWRDWRDWEDWENKKLKSEQDFFDVNSINIRDVIKNTGKPISNRKRKIGF